MAPRKVFDEELGVLSERLSRMCEIVEGMIGDCVTALNTLDRELGLSISETDKTVDELEIGIEKMCVKLLLKQQPVARDLLKITTALKVITDLERIGDQASDIGEMIYDYPEARKVTEPKRIKKMGEIAVAMVHQSVECFMNESIGGADMVISTDSEMDDLLLSINADLLQNIKDDPTSADEDLALLMMAKHMEKIGDHAVNVARWTKYLVTGVHPNKRQN